MTRVAIFTAALLASAIAFAAPADARRHHHRPPHGNWDNGHNNGWHNDWENRRDARRAGVVAGVVTATVIGAAAQEEVREQYRECMMATGYDYMCERQRYEDAQRARRGTRRAAVVVGVTTRAIVRD
jgi:hypothetical protein